MRSQLGPPGGQAGFLGSKATRTESGWQAQIGFGTRIRTEFAGAMGGGVEGDVRKVNDSSQSYFTGNGDDR